MKFPEPITFRGATSPVTVMKWILGIGIFEYPTGRPRRVISLCWSGTIFIIFLYFVRLAVLENLWNLENASISKISHQIYIITTIFHGTTFLYLGQLRSKNVVDSLCELDKVNEMLNKFGIPKEYGSTFKSQIIHLFGAFLFTLTMALFRVVCVFDDVSIGLIGSIIIGQYTVLVSFLEDYTFTTAVRYIGKRLRHLNSYLEKLSIKDGNAKLSLQGCDDQYVPWPSPTVLENHVQSRSVVGADKQRMIRIVQSAKIIHHDLCNTARSLNEAFGFQILLSMATAIGVITTLLYNTYTLFLMPTTTKSDIKIVILSDLPWIGFQIIKVFSIISACSMASTEAHQTGDQIHELVKPTTSNELREEIHAFSLQLMHNPLQFTACGFFTLDETMIRAMVGTVTTYLVFMIQMPYSFDRVNSSTTNAVVPAMNSTV